MRITRLFSLPFLCLALGACAAGDPSEIDAETGSDPIIRGTPVAPDYAGFVKIDERSGALLTNQWVLTAKHCGWSAAATCRWARS